MMTVVFLWLEITLFAAVSMAAVRSFFIRWENSFIRIGVPLAWFAALVLAGGWATAMSYILSGEVYEHAWPFWFFFIMTLCVFAGGGYVHFHGGERLEDGSLEAGRWPAARLSGVALILLLSVPATVELAYQLSLARIGLIKSNAVHAYFRMSPAPPEESEDAYRLYEKALGNLQGKDSKLREAGDILHRLDKGGGEAAVEARNYVKVRKEEIDNLKAAASMKRFSWKTNPALEVCWPAFDIFSPDLNFLLDASKALALEARIMALDNNINGVIYNMDTIYSMGRQMTSESPDLLAANRKIALYNFASRNLNRVIARNPSLDLKNISTPLDFERINGSTIKWALKGDAVLRRSTMAQAAFDRVSFTQISAQYDLVKYTDYCTNGQLMYEGRWLALSYFEKIYVFAGLENDLDYIQAMYFRLFELSKLEPVKFIQGVEDLSKRLPSLDSKEIEFNKKYPSTNIGYIPLSETRYFIISAYASEAKYYLSRVALAAQIYKARNGEYPASLDDLAPEYITEIPTDPFSGAPLRMKASPGGLVVYSVGPDFEDNGGHEGMDKRDSGFQEGEDIAVRLGTAYVTPES